MERPLVVEVDTSHSHNSFFDKERLYKISVHRFPGDVITHRADREGHWLIAVLKIESHFLILINIYGHKSVAQNRQMLEDITSEINELKALHPTDVILMGGDWNMVPDEWEDRWPSKFDNHHFNRIIEGFIRDNSLVDIWRTQNPRKKQYSWYKPNGTAKSRIDYWLVADMLEEFISEVLISKAPLTDHCITELTLNSSSRKKKNKGYWKFNYNLLKHKDYCSKIKEMITEIENDNSINSFCNKREFVKFKIREFSIKPVKN